MMNRYSHFFEPQKAKQSLSNTALSFVELMRKGKASVEYYAPVGVDLQKPHDQDEIYVIISGTGFFDLDGVKTPFKPADLIFVEAGVAHKFENFSDDFSTWVIFF